MRILGIETSADDTGIALIEANGDFGSDFSFKILANAVASQTIHAEYGGIYPNLAKNEHAKNLPILFEKVVRETPQIDAIAVTVGPGLEPCLWTGINFAQELAKRWNIPVVPVNHMEGHILVSLIEKNSLVPVEFPAIALLISGGHTDLVLMKEFQSYEYLGRTRDDAVGEAFDKVARMLDLPYPGGPHISRLAAEARKSKEIASHRISLPRPMMHEHNFDFSFAGLKTAVLRIVGKEKPLSDDMKRGIAREFEDAATEVLVAKTLHAVEATGAQTVIVGGGVSANTYIRAELSSALQSVSCKLFLSPLEFTGDNAVMIALAGYFRALNKEFVTPETMTAQANLRIVR